MLKKSLWEKNWGPSWFT